MRVEDLKQVARQRFDLSLCVPKKFFETEADKISQACWAMAQRFHRGGRILVFGNGAAATDAQHVSVEFVHPVLVGKRALPALALTNDSAVMSGFVSSPENTNANFTKQIRLLGRPQDMTLGFSFDGNCKNVIEALVEARSLGLLTLGFAGGNGGKMLQIGLDYLFVVPEKDPFVIQETHETLYHVLWELVHIFFEHEGLLGNSN